MRIGFPGDGIESFFCIELEKKRRGFCSMISSSKISNIEKLFWIQRFLIKALWDIETKLFILLDSQMASTFEMSFAKE